MKGNPNVEQFSREHDDLVLSWLKLRDEGVSTRAIGKRFGVSPGSVQRATHRAIKECDAHD